MNPDIVQYLPLAAGALFLGALALGSQTVIDKGTSLWKSVVSRFKKTNTNDDDLTSPLPEYSVHELLEELIERCEQESDTEGLMLLGAYGKHVYDLRLNPPPAPPKKKTTKKEAT